MRPSVRTALSTLLVAAALAGCAEPADTTPDEVDLPGFAEYLDDKADTGYVGTRAAELEATFSGRVRVLLPERSATDLEAIAAALRADPRNWEHRAITAQVTEQIKYARNALRAEALNLNLEGGSPTFSAIDVVEGGLDLHYAVSVEALVKFKDLEARGLTPQDLVGRVVQPRLPLVPGGLFERVRAACATDPDAPSGTVAEADLGAHNLFYYWDPARTGCPLTDADLVTGSYTVHSSLDAPTVYPEYDRLVADGRIDMVAIFGQIEHGVLNPYDWGFRSFNDFTRLWERRGFRRVETMPENRGHRLERTFPGGLVVRLTMYTPVSFADDVPRDQSNEVFRAAIRDNEIVYYNGHAFYGSLNVLDERTAYPEGTYQIIFMDACWSYAYYTKQIFRNRATEADPEGYALVDVFNNTEPGITGSEHTAVVAYEQILDGAAAVHAGRDATIYSWNNVVRYMNEHAEVRARQRTTHPDPEIYGVSGVSTNAWRPGGPATPPPTGGMRFESTTRVEIPDADPVGAESVIVVPDGLADVAALTVAIDVEHTYVGDLTVTLEHAGRTITLHDHTGAGTDNLSLRVSPSDFAGLSSAGDWKLRVVDSAEVDTGAITGWSITL